MKALNAIKLDLEKLSKVLADLSLASQEPGFNRAPAESHFLAQFYTGLESCLDKCLKLRGVNIGSQTSSYHKELLVNAIDSGLILDKHIEFIKDLLVFRHFTRHAYGVEIRSDEVNEKTKVIIEIWADLKANLLRQLP